MGEGENKMKNERKGLFGFLSMEMPHTYLLIFTILIICALLTYVVPAGSSRPPRTKPDAKCSSRGRSTT